jgi:hypothetical protein
MNEVEIKSTGKKRKNQKNQGFMECEQCVPKDSTDDMPF